MAFDEKCFETGDTKATFTVDCSRQQMDALDESMWDDVQDCITNSGGYEYVGGKNTKLDEVVALREKIGVYAMPVTLSFLAFVCRFGSVG